MTWLLMNTGREHRLIDYYAHPAAKPTPYAPPLGEIAHSLAHINRFTGHARRAYSVAEHSLLVADMVAQAGHGQVAQLCALMHDAHESITGDVATPIKQMLGNAWARFELAQQHALLAAYGLVKAMEQHAGMVKYFDLKALATERRDLLPFDAATHTPWPTIDTPGEEIRPCTDAYLMEPHRMATTPGTWAIAWKWRTAALIDAVQTHKEDSAKEAA